VEHDPAEWRQGYHGYSRRTASEYGQYTIQEAIHQGGAAAMGLDPRYLRCDCHGFTARVLHAVKGSFLTRNEEGKTRFDLPSVAGAYGTGMLSMYWYPSRYQPLSDGVRSGTQQIGFDTGMNLLDEFSPELKRFFHIRN
jgi:hypothetical protein